MAVTAAQAVGKHIIVSHIARHIAAGCLVECNIECQHLSHLLAAAESYSLHHSSLLHLERFFIQLRLCHRVGTIGGVTYFHIGAYARHFHLYLAVTHRCQLMVNVVHRACIFDTHCLQMWQHGIGTMQKSLPVLLATAAPSHLGCGKQAREKLVVHIGFRAAKFCPHRGLHSHQQVGILRFPILANRFVFIHIFKRDVPKISIRFEPLRSLVTNEIQHPCRSHDELVALCGSLGGSLAETAPAVNHHPLGQLMVGEFIPTHRYLALAAHVVAHALHEIALHVFEIIDMFGFHASLASRANPPIGLDSLVAAKVHILRREKSHHLIKHILQECKHAVVACAIYDLRIFAAPAGQHCDRLIDHRAGQLGISGKRRRRVGGHLNLGDNLDLPVGGVCHYLANVALRVKSAFIWYFARTLVGSSREHLVAVHAPCTHLHELGIAFYFDAPTCVIDKVQVQLIDF